LDFGLIALAFFFLTKKCIENRSLFAIIHSMDRRFVFERYYWLDSMIKSGRYPNRHDLADHFSITSRQASRDLDYMKNFLHAPLKYSRKKRGYYYSSEHFEFPKPRMTENELIGLIMADNMADSLDNRDTHKDIDAFARKIFEARGLDLDEIKKKLSIKNISYDKIKPQVFDPILQALHSNQKIRIVYRARFKLIQTSRVVNPLHIIFYMGNWYLYAYCEKRKNYRTFAFSRIHNVTLLKETIDHVHRNQNVKQLVEESFGIFLHDRVAERQKVVLKFKREIADMIREQVWVQSQVIEELDDGTVCVSFYVIDFTEITSEILKYGSNVEILEPHALREQIKEIISEMAMNYS
jgi:predicted DNA-binding transcriptional regulator YafY